MAAKPQPQKVECLNPNTGGRIKVDAATYELFYRAILETLSGGKTLTFTEMVKGVKAAVEKQKPAFSGSVEWYTVTIKNDMQSKSILSVFTEKGKKRHRLVETTH